MYCRSSLWSALVVLSFFREPKPETLKILSSLDIKLVFSKSNFENRSDFFSFTTTPYLSLSTSKYMEGWACWDKSLRAFTTSNWLAPAIANLRWSKRKTYSSVFFSDQPRRSLVFTSWILLWANNFSAKTSDCLSSSE